MTMTVAVVLATLATIVLLGWIGLRVRPAPFPDFSEASRDLDLVPLRQGLPAPVDRFYRSAYGDAVPLVHSAVITGRARIRPFGLWLPARFRFTHDAGRGYRHYIEATWFGLALLKVNERYLDGESLMELPWASDSGPKVEQAANLGMWAELSAAAPSVLVTDPRVRWEPIDDVTATLVVPFGDADEDRFTVCFDPQTAQVSSLEAMRYRESASEDKTRWTATNVGDRVVGPQRTLAVGSATWADQGRPWAVFETEDVRYDVDVREYLRARGI